MIRNNVEQVLEHIRKAEERSPYHQNVRLIAVSKFRSIEELEEIVACGLTELGENRVQELLQKYPVFEGRVNWHLIGTLQKNKVKYIIDKVSLIHSVDSISLAEEIEKQAAKKTLTANVLLQVNVAKEESKHGFDEEELEEALPKLAQLKHVRIRGMMVIAPDIENNEYLQKLFEKSRNIFDNLMKKTQNYDNMDIEILSMGMTNDYETAIECGSNMVRIGRALFN
ncbi:MAG: YggS family pyridoxal phosphate-dependent enzyme [Anaerofustis sp.]